MRHEAGTWSSLVPVPIIQPGVPATPLWLASQPEWVQLTHLSCGDCEVLHTEVAVFLSVTSHTGQSHTSPLSANTRESRATLCDKRLAREFIAAKLVFTPSAFSVSGAETGLWWGIMSRAKFIPSKPHFLPHIPAWEFLRWWPKLTMWSASLWVSIVSTCSVGSGSPRSHVATEWLGTEF